MLQAVRQGSKKILISALVIIIAGFGMTPAATAQLSSAASLDNPSGKYRADGTPLLTKSLDAAPSLRRQTTNATASFKAECPPTLKCVVIPAAYASNGNPLDYGNYDTANREKDMSINSIVVHDTEGNLESVLEAFQNPAFYASSHYVIAPDGTVYQMVQNKNIAWHAGNWWYNMHSIGIEHVGHAATGSTDYTPAMYTSSAKLVKWLADKYDVPEGRQHVPGHDNIPPTTTAALADMHYDPGPYWNWQKYMSLAGAPTLPTAGLKSSMVTVAPTWPLSKETVTGCWPYPDSCAASSDKPTNFVYMRAQPSNDAPMVTDVIVGQGSTDIDNNAARAFHGQTFSVIDRKVDKKGVWYQVWYGGSKAWFHSPWAAPTALPAKGQYATPKANVESVPLYGRPMPEQSEYPADFVPVPGSVSYPTPLAYELKAGEKYNVIDASVTNDFYYSWSFDDSVPYDHTVFHGDTEYALIEYNSRQYFVKTSDITIR